MTKDIYDRLEKFRGSLKGSVKSSFIRLSRGEMNKINEIYKELYGEALNKSQLLCNSCKLKACQRIGRDIERYEEWHNKRNKSELNSNPTDNQ